MATGIDWSILLDPYDVTLLDRLKTFLGLDLGDVTNDADLTNALNIAGYSIETYLDRIIAKREVTEDYRAHFGTVVLHHPNVDVPTGATVTLNGDAQTDYKVFVDRGGLAHLTRTGSRCDIPFDWRNYDQVVVTYTAGLDPIPTDLAEAICYTAAGFYKSTGSGAVPGGSSGDVKSVSIYDVGSIAYDVGSSSGSGGGTFVAPGAIPSVAADMLARYKRISA